MPAYQDPAVRFWSKVNKAGPLPPGRPDLGPCWLWTGARSRGNGGLYGTLRLPRSRASVRAHRWSWEQERGPIPDGLTIDHLCRVTLCVRTSHLEPVVNRVNILRGTNTAAVHARKTHCVHNHPLSGENTYIAASGQRMCRTCRRGWERDRKARLRAARVA